MWDNPTLIHRKNILAKDNVDIINGEKLFDRFADHK